MRKLEKRFAATEKLLYAYPKLQRLVESPTAYGWDRLERSKSIIHAPVDGSHQQPDELEAEYERARMRSYMRTRARFAELSRVLDLFRDRPEFIVIRMYYFAENIDGSQRKGGLATFEDISLDMFDEGIYRSERTLRKWRRKLVEEIATVLFGSDDDESCSVRGKVEICEANTT